MSIGRGLLPLVLLLGAALHAGATQATQTQDVRVVLEEDDWVAFRVNFSGPSDFLLQGTLYGCNHGADGRYQAVTGGAVLLILDGGFRPRPQVLIPGDSAWGPFGDSAQANVAGHRVTQPALRTDDNCGSTTLGAGQRLGATTNLTVVAVPLGLLRYVDFHATWSYGVASWDVASGSAVVRNQNGFETGAAASVYGPASAGAAALATLHEETHGDAIGWFWPDDGQSPGVVDAACLKGGASCGTRDRFGLWTFSANAPTAWDFSLRASLLAGSPPKYILGLIAFPDDSFLTEANG